MSFKFWASATFLSVLCGCGKPIVRSEGSGKPQGPKSAASSEEGNYQGADLKKRLWILPFLEAPQSSSAELAKIAVSEILQPRMVDAFSGEKSPFVTADEEQQSLKELNVDSSMPAEEVAKMSRGAGVTGFIRGEITTLQLKEVKSSEGLLNNKTVELQLGVNFEVFDANTGRRLGSGHEMQVYTETRSDLFGMEMALPELSEKLEDLSQRMSQRLLVKVAPFSEKMGWEGRILRTDSSKVYINAGRRTGIQIGDVMKVVDPSREIRDNGSYMGQAPGRMKGTLKVIQFFGLDGSIAVIQSGGGVRIGDRVELY